MAFRDFYVEKLGCAPISLSEPRPKELVLSDVVLHLPVLQWYASLCDHVTEFGTRDGHSTTALVAGCKDIVHSYDIEKTNFVYAFEKVVKPCRWVFHKASTVDPTIGVEPTDLLYVDTLHTYSHVSRELALWGRQARRFLAFHDTFTCGTTDRSGPNPREKGILPAIEEFLARFPGEYRTVYRTDWCNGLWILERC